ncbi:MAG: hypothetical protein ACLR2G_06425 [Phascolarctobacterium faecium]
MKKWTLLAWTHTNCGHLHPVTLTLREIKRFLCGWGLMSWKALNESDYYNFEALNLPQDHPARDMQDTFYITEKFCCVPRLHLCRLVQCRPVSLNTDQDDRPWNSLPQRL